MSSLLLDQIRAFHPHVARTANAGTLMEGRPALVWPTTLEVLLIAGRNAASIRIAAAIWPASTKCAATLAPVHAGLGLFAT